MLFSLAIFFARGEAKILEFELTDKVSTVSTISGVSEVSGDSGVRSLIFSIL